MTEVPFATVGDAVAWAAAHGGGWNETLVQALASEDEPAIDWPDDLADDDTSDEQKRRAAVLAGAVLRRRIGGSRTYPEETLLADVAYGAALATPQGQRCLREVPPNPLKAHAYACVLTERHGHSVTEADEAGLFTWLLATLGLEPSETMIARMRRQRLLRHERLAAR